MFHFYTPWKRQKNRFSDVFRVYRSKTLAGNGLSISTSEYKSKCRYIFENDIKIFSQLTSSSKVLRKSIVSSNMTELLLLLTFSFEYKNLGCSYSESHSPVGTPANRTYISVHMTSRISYKRRMYNRENNILRKSSILVKIWLATSKAALDIKYDKRWVQVHLRVAERIILKVLGN